MKSHARITLITELEMNLGQYVHEVRRVLCNQRVDFFGKMSGHLITPEEIVRNVLYV